MTVCIRSLTFILGYLTSQLPLAIQALVMMTFVYILSTVKAVPTRFASAHNVPPSADLELTASFHSYNVHQDSKATNPPTDDEGPDLPGLHLEETPRQHEQGVQTIHCEDLTTRPSRRLLPPPPLPQSGTENPPAKAVRTVISTAYSCSDIPGCTSKPWSSSSPRTHCMAETIGLDATSCDGLRRSGNAELAAEEAHLRVPQSQASPGSGCLSPPAGEHMSFSSSSLSLLSVASDNFRYDTESDNEEVYTDFTHPSAEEEQFQSAPITQANHNNKHNINMSELLRNSKRLLEDGRRHLAMGRQPRQGSGPVRRLRKRKGWYAHDLGE